MIATDTSYDRQVSQTMCVAWRMQAVHSGWLMAIDRFVFGIPGARPHIITGENLSAPDLEIWTWDPSSSDEDISRSIDTLGRSTKLPESPPKKGKLAGKVAFFVELTVKVL